MELIGANPEQQLPVWMPLIYVAENIQDLHGSRERFFQDARTEYERRLKIRDANPFALRTFQKIIGFPDNPAYQTSVLTGRKTVETAHALIAIPSVRHLPDRDHSGRLNRLTIFDNTGELQIETIPETQENWILLRLLREAGFPIQSEDALKKLDWASGIILLSDLQSVDGQPKRDRHQLFGAFNEHIGDQRRIPTLLGKLIMAGLSVRPDSS